MSDDTLDNLLVEQKNRLITLIDSGGVDAAQLCLWVLTPLWQSCHYDYKIRELQERINNWRHNSSGANFGK